MIQRLALFVCLMTVGQFAVAQQERFQEGVHYVKFDQVTAPAAGEVEVIEVFSYMCSHCNTFEPYMQSWKSSKAENVTLNRIPVGFGRRAWELLAQGYVTAELLGIADESHVPMMNAIWKQGQQMRSLDDLATFYSQFGVDKEAYIATFNSFAADSMMRKEQRDAQLFGVNATPTLIVNRQYKVSNNKNVSSFPAMLDVVNFLIEKEQSVE